MDPTQSCELLRDIPVAPHSAWPSYKPKKTVQHSVFGLVEIAVCKLTKILENCLEIHCFHTDIYCCVQCADENITKSTDLNGVAAHYLQDIKP